MFICVNDNNKKYRVGRVDWLKEGDAVNIIYLPFTKYATIYKVETVVNIRNFFGEYVSERALSI